MSSKNRPYHSGCWVKQSRSGTGHDACASRRPTATAPEKAHLSMARDGKQSAGTPKGALCPIVFRNDVRRGRYLLTSHLVETPGLRLFSSLPISFHGLQRPSGAPMLRLDPFTLRWFLSEPVSELYKHDSDVDSQTDSNHILITLCLYCTLLGLLLCTLSVSISSPLCSATRSPTKDDSHTTRFAL